jgi:uncharacterized membrane protein YjfL (UPF0719 family)
MSKWLLWIDDERAPGRGRLIMAALVLAGMLVGVVVGLAVGQPKLGMLAGIFTACAVGVVVGVAAFVAGKRAHNETAWQHVKRSNTLSSYGK